MQPDRDPIMPGDGPLCLKVFAALAFLAAALVQEPACHFPTLSPLRSRSHSLMQPLTQGGSPFAEPASCAAVCISAGQRFSLLLAASQSSLNSQNAWRGPRLHDAQRYCMPENSTASLHHPAVQTLRLRSRTLMGWEEKQRHRSVWSCFGSSNFWLWAWPLNHGSAYIYPLSFPIPSMLL
jgi:hypothetical protein